MNFRTVASAVAIVAGLSAALPAAAPASSTEPFKLTLRDHRFEPARIQVPAGQVFTLRVENTDASPEHFDSRDLRIEKVIRGNSAGLITIRPLTPGEYHFIGVYNKKTAKGVIVAK